MKTIPRIENIYRPEATRVEDYNEVERKFNAEELTMQASRCMDCGIPFCHGLGCPLGNVIPEMNEAVRTLNWKRAYEILSKTSNMPEFTSRVCPAICENACTKNIENIPVMIRQLEKSVIENAFENGYVKQIIPENKSGKNVAVVGAGPSGLYMAFELYKKGHNVTVYEKRKYAGGLLRYGIPDFKLEKNIIERRIDILINCAGFGISGAVEFTESIDVKRQMDVNFFGMVYATKSVLPIMRQIGKGHIVNISSVAAIAPIPFQTYYSVSKAAINAYSAALANEVKPYGISVTAVLPGDIATEFTQSRNKSALGDIEYNGRISRSVTKMEQNEQSGMCPVKAGLYIAKIAQKKKVKPMYTIGFTYKCISLLVKFLPCSFVNWLIGFLYSR